MTNDIIPDHGADIRQSPVRRQPSEAASTPFDFAAIEEAEYLESIRQESDPVRAAMHRPEFEPAADNDVDRQEMAQALSAILDWLVPKHGLVRPRGFSICCGLRVIAMAWALNPDRFDGLSLHKLSLALGVSDSILSRYGQQFAQRFGVQSSRQRSAREIAARKVARSMPTPPADPSAN